MGGWQYNRRVHKYRDARSRLETDGLHYKEGAKAMFGSKKNKEYDVRLTDKQIQQITKDMSRSERKEFNKRQRQMEADRQWDAMIMSELFMDD